MIYDNRGEPTYLGYSVEPHYGEYWVKKVAYNLRISEREASERLERGNGGHPLTEEQFQEILAATIAGG